MTRRCGDCQLCCKLLPVRELDKHGNQRCRHQKTGKGCCVYGTAQMPPSCKLWSCRWLVDARTAALRRPDRSGYVVDLMPDFVTMSDDVSGEKITIPVIQIWVDPVRPDAWRGDHDLMAFIEAMAVEEGTAALLRNGEEKAIFLAPPSLNSGGTWFETGSGVGGPTHTAQDMLDAGYALNMVVEQR